MKTLILIFHLLVCIFEIWMLSDFYDAFLGYKNKGKKRNIFIVLCFALIIFAINSFNNTVLNLSVVPFMYFLLAVVGFSGNIYKKIFGTFIGTVVLMGTELIVVGALSVTSQQLIESSMMYEPSAIMLTVIVKIVTLMVFAVIKQFVAKEGTNMDGATFMLYMVLPLSSIGIMFSVAFCNIDFGNVTLAKCCLAIFCILLMAGNGTAFYAYNRYAKLCMEREINKRTVLMQEMELENYKKINQANDKYMELLHNSNHYMRTVYGLLEQDNKDEAINIMDSVLTEYEEGELIEYSTNSILNTILSEYYDKSKTNHIEFNIFVEPGFNIECVESMDLVAMVSNLISNAYEAALKSDEKKIKVQMYMQNDGSFIIIKIENSFSGEIVSQGDRLLTTKKDGNIHDVGIESVEKVAEKYDGWVSTSWGNKSVITSKITYTISLVMHNFSIQISIMTIIKLDKIAHCQNSFACQPPAKLLNGITARRKSPTASHLPVIKQIIKAMAILINFSKNSVYPYRYTLPSSSLIFPEAIWQSTI